MIIIVEMKIPKTILQHVSVPYWKGIIQDEIIEIYYDHEMSKLSSGDVYAVFSKQGFHGWLDYGYDEIQRLWISTSIPIDYQQALNEFSQIQQLTSN